MYAGRITPCLSQCIHHIPGTGYRPPYSERIMRVTDNCHKNWNREWPILLNNSKEFRMFNLYTNKTSFIILQIITWLTKIWRRNFTEIPSRLRISNTYRDLVEELPHAAIVSLNEIIHENHEVLLPSKSIGKCRSTVEYIVQRLHIVKHESISSLITHIDWTLLKNDSHNRNSDDCCLI